MKTQICCAMVSKKKNSKYSICFIPDTSFHENKKNKINENEHKIGSDVSKW